MNLNSGLLVLFLITSALLWTFSLKGTLALSLRTRLWPELGVSVRLHRAIHRLKRPRSRYLYPVEYSGKAKFPKRVYEGDSYTITVCLKPRFPLSVMYAAPRGIFDQGQGKEIVLPLAEDSRVEQSLECEIFAAGLASGGEREQRQPLLSDSLTYRWKLRSPKSGNQAIALVFRLISPPETMEVGTIRHQIHVVRLDHLSRRKMWIMATGSGIVTGGLAVVEILRRLSA